MQHDAQQKGTSLLEYGRSIRDMIDFVLTIQDRSERQHYANTVISIMDNMLSHLRDVPDSKHKSWDHLVIMSDFKLDIGYPHEVTRKDSLVMKPDSIPYPNTKIRYRHYGRTLEVLTRKACEFSEGNEKKNLVTLIYNHTKKDYIAWGKDTVDDREIAEDLAEFSGGKLQMDGEVLRLISKRITRNHRPRMNNNNNQRNNNQKRRF